MMEKEAHLTGREEIGEGGKGIPTRRLFRL